MDLREINEKRYEIAAAQASTIMLIGLFSNLGIFAITAFAELNPDTQTSWKVIVSIIEAFFMCGGLDDVERKAAELAKN